MLFNEIKMCSSVPKRGTNYQLYALTSPYSKRSSLWYFEDGIYKEIVPTGFAPSMPSKLEFDPHLYAMDYSDYDYDIAYKYFKKYSAPIGACSQVIKGSLIGRNFDWNYSDVVEFVISTPETSSRYATLGVAYGPKTLVAETINNPSIDYEILPFLMVDCMNDHGLYVSTNVVPSGDYGHTTGTNPTADTSVCQVMLPRFLCDYAYDLESAIDLLESINVFAPVRENQELHTIIVDADGNSAVIEFINNTLTVIEDPKIVTNFYHYGWSGDIKAVFLGDSVADVTATGLTDHAAGLERYLILEDGYENVEDVRTMMDLMKSVKYTQAYDIPWLSEFTGYTETFDDLTIFSPANHFNDILAYSRKERAHSTRKDALSWQTVHSSVYDIQNKTLALCIQEDYLTTYNFSLT